jgi:UDP-glucuronate 4-epimerase
MIKILVTGSAGFIGYHLIKKLISLGFQVYGIDNLNDYYNVNLKKDRLAELGIDVNSENFLKQAEIKSTISNFRFRQIDLVEDQKLDILFRKEKFDCVINLAAQAGVRYSIDNPKVYVQSNLVGFINVLEACRQNKIKHLIYASSSSVYGNQEKVPFSEEDSVDKPISLYAATKKSNELMAHVYSHLYGLPTTGLRFFTVYGPWGRPDMAPFLFTKAILSGNPIKVFNNGNLMRDFTYIDDIINGVVGVLKSKVKSGAYQLYNIGNNDPVKLLDFIKSLEHACGTSAKLIMHPMQDGDVYKTYANTDALHNLCGYKASVDIDFGLKKFVGWYKTYYKIST